jgi:hypothetical protein
MGRPASETRNGHVHDVRFSEIDLCSVVGFQNRGGLFRSFLLRGMQWDCALRLIRMSSCVEKIVESCFDGARNRSSVGFESDSRLRVLFSSAFWRPSSHLAVELPSSLEQVALRAGRKELAHNRWSIRSLTFVLPSRLRELPLSGIGDSSVGEDCTIWAHLAKGDLALCEFSSGAAPGVFRDSARERQASDERGFLDRFRNELSSSFEIR